MLIISFISIITSVIAIMYEDWKYLEIHVGWFFLLFIGIGFFSYWYFSPIGFHFFWPSLLLNMTISILLFISTTIFISIKNKRLVNIIDTHLGLGDIISILLIGIWLFTSFFLLTIILSSITGVVLQKIHYSPKIPLATYLIGWAFMFHCITYINIAL